MGNSYAIQKVVTCQNCEQASTFDVWQIVDIEEKPDLLKKIMEGTLHDAYCPQCKKLIVPIDSPLLVYRPDNNPTFLYSSSEETTFKQDIENLEKLLGKLKSSLGFHWPENWEDSCRPGLPSRTIMPIFLREGEVAAQIATMDLQRKNNATRKELIILIDSYIKAKTITEIRDILKSNFYALTSFHAVGYINEIIEARPSDKLTKTAITRKLLLIRYREIGLEKALLELDQLELENLSANDDQGTFLSQIRNIFKKQEPDDVTPKFQPNTTREKTNPSINNKNQHQTFLTNIDDNRSNQKSHERLQHEKEILELLKEKNLAQPESNRFSEEYLRKMMYRTLGDYESAGDDPKLSITKILITHIPGESEENNYSAESIMGALRFSMAGFENIHIYYTQESISQSLGSSYARDLGKKYQADSVIWGYFETNNGGINQKVFVENLTNRQFSQTPSQNAKRLKRRFGNVVSFCLNQGSTHSGALINFLGGIILFQNSLFDMAYENFTKSLTLQDWKNEPRNQSIAYFYRGLVNIFLNHPDAAIEDLNNAIEIAPNNLLFITRGNAFAVLNQIQRALNDFSQAIKSNPQDPRPYFNRALLLSDIGETDKAINDYSQVIMLTPKDYLAYLYRGLGYGKIHEHKKALSDFSKAIELNPNDAEAYNHRGTTYSIKGEFAKAIPDLSQAISLEPDDEDSLAKRGEAFIKVGDYDRALADCSRAIELDPSHADTFSHRAFAFTKKGEFTKALADYDRAIMLDPNLAVAYGERGMLYAMKGDLNKARQDLRVAVKLDPMYESIYRQWENVQNMN